MNQRKHLPLSIAVVLTFSACVDKNLPQNNQAVIEDIVRYNIAATNLYLDVTIKCMDEKTCYYESGDFWGDTMSGLPKCGSSGKRMFDKFDKRFDRFEEQLLTLVQDDETDSIYYNGLLQMSMSGPYADMASDLLSRYRELDITLSEYTEVPTSTNDRMWQFQEFNTQMLFNYIVIDTNWTCELEERSVEKYFMRNI